MYTEEKTKAPSGDNTELLIKLRGFVALSRERNSRWKKDAKTWYDLVAGEQWSPEDKAELLDTMRQPITFNRVGPMVDAVTGAEVLNRQAVIFYPREVGDAQVSELYTGAADWVRDNCDAEDHESDAFSDLIICGMGWTETFLDYEDNPEGDIKVPRLDPLEMGWDPDAKARNLADSRFRFRERSFDRDAFKAKYGQEMYDRVLAAQEQATDPDAADSVDVAYDEYRNDHGRDGPGARTKLTVIQIQWFDLEDGYAIHDPVTGMVEAIEKDQYKAIVNMALMEGMPPPEAVKQKRKAYYQALYTGNVLIEKKPLKCRHFTLNCMTGKRDRNNRSWYGLVKAMADPQMWANKWLSQLLHIINSNAKGGLLFETGAFVNQKKAEQEWARPDSMVELSPGALSRGTVQPKQPPALPAGLRDLLEFSVESLPQVSGINLEMLGLVQREQAGVLEAQRKRSGYAILAVFFDALRKYRKEQGRVLLDYIQRYISDGRLVRLQGDRGVQYVPLMKQPGVAKYDVVVDEAPMSANQKDMVWQMLTQMMPMLKDAPIPMDVWGKLLEYSPLPQSLSAEISKALVEGGQEKGPNPIEQMQLADMQAGVRQKNAQALLNEAKAAEIGAPSGGPDPMAQQKDQAQAALNAAKARKTEVEASLLPAEHVRKVAMDLNTVMTPQVSESPEFAAG